MGDTFSLYYVENKIHGVVETSPLPCKGRGRGGYHCKKICGNNPNIARNTVILHKISVVEETQ
jgi:hypothetical protein